MTKYPFADVIFKKHPALRYIIWISWFHSVFLLFVAWIMFMGLLRILFGSPTTSVVILFLTIVLPLSLLSIATILFWSNSQLVRYNNRARIAVVVINGLFFLLLLYFNLRTVVGGVSAALFLPVLYMAACAYPVINLTADKSLVAEFK